MIKLNPIEIAATYQVYAAELTERLCKPFCENASIQPVVDGNVTIDNVTLIGDVEYVRVKVQGIVTYVAQRDSPCCPSSKVITEYFTVAFANVQELKTPSVDVALGYIEPAYVNCCGIACGISAVGTITIKIPA